MDNVIQFVGNRIRDVRNKTGLTQFELAERAGLNLSWLGQIERGQRTATIITLSKICGALNISLGELFRESQKHSFQKGDLIIRELRELLKGQSEEDKQFIIEVVRRICKKPEQPIKKAKRI